MAGGTEAFPDLGRHCQHEDCHQLDFLPFECDGCRKVFCSEHRSYRSHECPKSDHKSRKVVVCEICSVSIETTGSNEEDEKVVLEKHERSGDCDPSKKKKPKCPVKRCKETLTFSNTNTCRICQQKVCLKHRFPADHVCRQPVNAAVASGTNKFLLALAARKGIHCAASTASVSPSSSSRASSGPPSVKAH
ncbi:hypothetical protein NE237_021275 [Protea cynaroides]|uniref:AN1-type domain-containing protein n=1 Tax=Protea cynaroides TaxID=273540 RepID=A0A9Q0H8T5_9MAGN|nr:hypothetical protein NE237_021275 [Protea cynaroides]